MLVLNGLTKDFGEKLAVDSVDLDLLPGERFCLMGPNGAGKTTVMRMMVGLSRPTRGSVELLGGDPLEEPAIRRNLGYLSDKPYIYDKLTSREHLRLHAALYKLPFREILHKGTALLDRLGMGEALDQRAETLSLGMQKKLALALALAHEPKIMILDEPMNGLDPDSAERVEKLLVRYSEDNRSVFLSTHSVEFAARFASRVGVLQEGGLTVHEVREAVEARWIRDLLSQEGDRPEGRRQIDRINEEQVSQ